MTFDRSQHVIVGNVDKLGPAWWGVGDMRIDGVHHFAGPVPMPVARDLLNSANVSAEKIYTLNANGEYVEIPNMRAMQRITTGRVHKVFSDGYTPTAGDTLIDTVEPWLQGEVQVGSVGTLRHGALSFIQLEVAESISVEKFGETFRPYLLCADSKDGSIAETYKRCVTRAVCYNTVSAALGESGGVVRRKHTKNGRIDIRDAVQALGLIEATIDDYIAEMTMLIETTVTDRQWFAFLDANTPLLDAKTGELKTGKSLTLAEKERDALSTLWTRDMRVAPWKNTAWGVVQAVNTHTTHDATVRGVNGDRSERNRIRNITGQTEAMDLSTLDTLRKVLAAA